MHIALYGGFGEKGRTCLGVHGAGCALLIDAGVKTSAAGSADYYPAITPAELATYDAMIVTHGHEDHVAALGWCLSNGFRGRLLMTAQTRREADESLAGYASAAERACVAAAAVEPLPLRTTFELGAMRITTGRSGHIAGGAWCLLDDAHVRFGYCGDVVPASPVFAMDPLPACDVLALDASYGDDAVSAAERAAQVARWVQAQSQGCILPTPLFGRSAELLAIVPGPIALAPGMRAALDVQIADADWLAPPARARLAARLASATDWAADDALPRAALLCHDAMGMAGPARAILARARRERHATLFTGHVPERTPGASMLAEGLAQWIRLPTHPTGPENIELAQRSGARMLLGHSCEPGTLAGLAARLPRLRTDVATGARIDL